MQMVKNLIAALRADIDDAAMDERRDTEAGARQSWLPFTQDRLSRQMARLFRRSTVDRGVLSCKMCCARSEFEFASPAGEDRQAGGPRRMGHDAADGQRLLQSAA